MRSKVRKIRGAIIGRRRKRRAPREKTQASETEEAVLVILKGTAKTSTSRTSISSSPSYRVPTIPTLSLSLFVACAFNSLLSSALYCVEGHRSLPPTFNRHSALLFVSYSPHHHQTTFDGLAALAMVNLAEY